MKEGKEARPRDVRATVWNGQVPGARKSSGAKERENRWNGEKARGGGHCDVWRGEACLGRKLTRKCYVIDREAGVP